MLLAGLEIRAPDQVAPLGEILLDGLREVARGTHDYGRAGWLKTIAEFRRGEHAPGFLINLVYDPGISLCRRQHAVPEI